jgi:uncharacterized membrane protein HdeD (DUF308 family)
LAYELQLKKFTHKAREKNMLVLEPNIVYKNRFWLSICGMMLSLFGLIVIAGYLMNRIAGIVPIAIIFAALFILLHTYKFWLRKWLGFSLHLLAGILYLALSWLLVYPQALNFWVVLFSLSYLAMGIFRIALGEKHQHNQNGWRWTALAGFINLILCGVVLYAFNWPILILACGTDLIFMGIALLMLDKSAKIV